MMLAGTGGLPPEQASLILSNLAASTPTAPDGMVPGGVYPQRFGIPEGLYAEPVAVKQGWMCCIGSDWMHLSTGVIGPDRRYVMVISSMQATRRDRRSRDHHPGREDDVPRRPHLAVAPARTLSPIQQVRPALARSPQRLLATPGSDLRVVAGQQHGWYVELTPTDRPGVARPLQQPVASANHPGAKRDCRGRRAAAEPPPRS